MRFSLVGLGIVVIALAACQAPPTGAEAQATFCGDLRALNRTVVALSSTTGVANVGEFKARMQAVDDSWNDLKESAKAVPQARMNDVETAYNDLKQTVTGLPSDTTLNQAAQTVQPKVAAATQAQRQVGSGLRCPGMS